MICLIKGIKPFASAMTTASTYSVAYYADIHYPGGRVWTPALQKIFEDKNVCLVATYYLQRVLCLLGLVVGRERTPAKLTKCIGGVVIPAARQRRHRRRQVRRRNRGLQRALAADAKPNAMRIDKTSAPHWVSSQQIYQSFEQEVCGKGQAYGKDVTKSRMHKTLT
jgi:hypothetical protein